jgi:DNA-binding PadR family transcriptional regulator
MLTDGPAHPYSIDARLRSEGAPTEVAFSSIYAALSRLENLELVASRPDEGARGKARRVYRLTPQGRTVLRESVKTTLAQPLSGTRPNDLGISNLGMLSRQDALDAIAEARKSLHASKKQKDLGETYPATALSLHHSMIHSAEERFYAELERLVEREHPERTRRRLEEESA